MSERKKTERKYPDFAYTRKGIPVWVLIGHVNDCGGDANKAFERLNEGQHPDSQVGLDDFEHSIEYYGNNRREIDHRLKEIGVQPSIKPSDIKLTVATRR